MEQKEHESHGLKIRPQVLYTEELEESKVCLMPAPTDSEICILTQGSFE